MTAPLSETLARYGDLIDAELHRLFDGQIAAAPALDGSSGNSGIAVPALHDFYGMMRYHLGWTDERLQPLAAPRGKGLRGALLLLMHEACGGAELEATPLAAAVELLHNFSLVHDDIEDGSATRRHRPTAWSLWGPPLTINMGDGMYALAYLALYQSPLRHAAPERFIEITRGFARATLHLCEGQHLDMSFEQAAEVTVGQYQRMIGGKSATLIATAAWMGAYAADVAGEQAQRARRFGFELGMAFQMQDDILGIWGDEAVTGKSAMSDITSRKKTLPILLAMADPREGERLRALYSADAGAVETQEILAILDRVGARDQTAAFLRRHRDAGLAALREMDLPAAMYEQLLSVTSLFVDRAS